MLGDRHLAALGVDDGTADRLLRRGELVAFSFGLTKHSLPAAVREARINGTDAVPLLTELLEEFPDSRLSIDIKAG